MNLTPVENPLLPIDYTWQQRTRVRTDEVAGIIHRHLDNLKFQEIKGLTAVEPAKILPSASLILPADQKVMSKTFPGYQQVTGHELKALKDYAQAKENHGTVPGETAALIVGITRALLPETAFVFGTARGRTELLIAKNCQAEIATIDIPTELLEAAPGRPASNDIRCRKTIGIDCDKKIGEIFRMEADISGRVHQILGDSFTFQAQKLSNSMRLIVVDGNHSLENSLTDLATALEMIHKSGGVIIVDDFKKTSPLYHGVDTAVGIFNKITGLPVLYPCLKQAKEELNAAAAVIVVPENFNKTAAILNLRVLVKQFSI